MMLEGAETKWERKVMTYEQKYSSLRPEGYYPPLQGKQHHCNRMDCEWYYDGTTAKRAIKPRYVKTWLEQNNVKPDPFPDYWVEEYIHKLQLQIRDERRRGGNE